MYAKILVPVDDSPTAEAGLQEAIRLARLAGGQLRLLHIAAESAYVSEAAIYSETPDLVTEGMQRGATLLERLRGKVMRENIPVGTVLIESSGQSTPEFIADQAAAWGAEVIVLGTHGRRGVGRVVHGSVAEQVVRHATMPVLLVRCPGEAAPGGPALQSIAAAIA